MAAQEKEQEKEIQRGGARMKKELKALKCKSYFQTGRAL